MNKNRHRLVFNPARKQLMAVSETAASRGKGAGTAAGPALPGLPSAAIIAALHPLAFRLLSALGMVAVLGQPVQAQIVADPGAPGNQQPTVAQADNGVPLVNIQTPSAAGVSRNLYSQFDVDQQGVILNNAVTNASTQLGGWIQGNPYLAGGSAHVILNEVNSANPSQLLGYVEVGGSRAQVVIANPAGITCDGCGFINASRATLTTGTPTLNGGSLDGYRVQRGQITVQGAGLDASQTDYTDLIAHAVHVNAGIWAQQLGVTTGTNEVDAANAVATPIAGSGSAPTVSIDVAALGGMYARKITLVGTEAGVGVRNAGQIGASAGDVVITAAGHLLNSGQLASAGNIDITSGGLTNSGTLIAQNHAVLSSDADVGNAGVLAAGADLSVSANTIDNRGALLNAGGTLSIQTNTLDNSGTQGADHGIQAGAVAIRASRIDNSSGTISADGALAVTSSGTLDNTQGFMAAGDTLALLDAEATKALAITNTLGTLIAGRSLQVDAAGLSGDGSLLSPGDLEVRLTSDYLHRGELIANGTAVFQTSGTLTNQAQMLAGNALAVSAAAIDNTASGEFSAAATMLSATGLLANRGLIDGSETLVTAGILDNLGTGRIFGDHLAIAATTLNNTSENGAGAVIAARDRLDIGVQTLTNQENALIFSAGDLAIGGALDANRHATRQASLVVNSGATLEALGTLTINALELRNLNADLVIQQVNDPATYEESVQPRGSATSYPIADCSGIGGGQDANGCLGYPGTFEDYTWLKVTSTPSHTEVLSTQPGQLLSGADMVLAGGSVLNQDSHIVAGGLLELSGASVANLATQGQEITTYSGTAQFTHVESCGTFGDKHCRKWDPVTAYNPAPAYGTPYDLPTAQLAQNTAPAGSGTTLADARGAAAIDTIAPAALLGNALFQPNPDPTAGYLIETDPRFADYRTWLSSDYLLGQLGMDPAFMQKRLGDGFYEQRLIREQVAQLTGRRFLDGYANDEAQYRALMSAGLTYAQEWNLIPGVELTAAQMAQLTSDIVWLVAQEVTLPDGRSETALVPQVYVRVRPGDLDGSGSLLSGQTVNLNVSGDVVNSGSVAGRQLVKIDAANVRNLGGRISGSNVALTAQQNIDNLGGSVDAADSLIAIAGRDINVVSTTRDSENTAGSSSFTRTAVERVAGLYVSAPAGVLLASAGRDVTLTAAVIGNSGAGGQTLIDAGSDLNLTTVATGRQDNIVWGDQNHLNQGSTVEVGTVIQTRGDVIIAAGHDLAARAAEVNSASGAIRASAGRDVRLSSGESTQNWSEARHITKSDVFSSTTVTNLDETHDTRALAASFSGDSVDLQAGRDIGIRGSNVVSDSGTRLAAGNGVSIEAATETHGETHHADKQKSGLFTSGGLSITYGDQQTTQNAGSVSTYAAGSTVGSTQGNVAIEAGKSYTQTGSDVLAPQGDIGIAAQRVEIVEARESSRSETEARFRQSGLTVALTSPVISAVETIEQMKDAADDTSGGRMKALAAGTAALAGAGAYSAIKAGQGTTVNGSDHQIITGKDEDGNLTSRDATLAERAGGVSVSLSVGTSQGSSNSVQTASTTHGSTLAAGGNVDIRATGAGANSDLTVQGSTVRSGHDVALQADDEISLLGAESTFDQHSRNSNSSASVGVSVGTSGYGISAAASRGIGRSDGSDTSWTNTHVEAANQLTLQSGGDATLKGAVASGNQVVADVGGNFAIESLQDTSRYDSKQQNVGGSLTVGVGVSGSVSASKSKVHSDYASVGEQSGIQAGDGGFDITVNGNTDLKGAVIESTQGAVHQGRNSLTTGTLTTSDIQNRAEASAKSSGISLDSSMATQGKYGVAKAAIGTALNNASESGSSNGQTIVAISGGAVRISDEMQQLEQTGHTVAETIGSLNRDTANAHVAAEWQDVEAMRQTVEAEREIKEAAFKEAVKFSDEAYRVSFLEKARMYRVARDPESGEAIKGVDGDPVMTELTDSEKLALKPEPGGRLNVFTNGIFNDEAAAARYAVQMSELPPGQDVYLVYYPQAGNPISELMVAGYQKFLEGGIGDLSNASQEMKNLMGHHGADGLNLVGHSRGAMTIGNAMEVLSEQGGSGGMLNNTEIKFVGPAYNAQDAANMLDAMSNGNRSVVLLQNHADDFVGTLIGGNPATYGQRPAESSRLNEWWRILGDAPTVHSCYGTGAVSVDCPKYGNPITVEISKGGNR